MLSAKDVVTLIGFGAKTTRTLLTQFIDFIGDNVVGRCGTWHLARVVLGILLVLIGIVVSVVVVLGWIALGLLLMPLLTYVGWNWTIPLTQFNTITIHTAIGMNIAAIVLLGLLRSIVTRIKN